MKKAASIARGLADRHCASGAGGARICVTGRRVLIENHRGVLECTGERILLSTGREKLAVQGTNLIIEAMNGSEMLISGKIRSLEWE